MDDLKQSVQTAVYEQKDPLIIYKQTAFQLFSEMDVSVNKEIVSFLCHAGLPVDQGAAPLREGKESRTDMSRMQVRKDDVSGKPSSELLESDKAYNDPSEQIKQEPVRVGPKIGRNDTCPCGSGKKFKACHGKE
jgi:preprotein translocase subunit SecA